MAKTFNELLAEVKKTMPNVSEKEQNDIALSLFDNENSNEITKMETQRATHLKDDFIKKRQNGIWKISQYLINRYHIKTITEAKPEIYIYKNGVYQEGEAVLRFAIQHILEELYRNGDVQEILGKIKDQTPFKRDDFDIDKEKINLKNGVLNILTGELMSHKPENLFLNILPVEYNKDADCLGIRKFLSEVLKDDDISVMQEWVGYCLYRRYLIKKAMILVGEPDTGKTTFLRLLTRLLGDKNLAGVSLQKLATDKFSVGQLYGKYANIYDDLSFRDIQDNGLFKIATGGGYITGEYKFGNQFNFENYAKLIFACNKIPKIKDIYDDAYFGRWIVIRFDNVIEKKDPELITKLTSDDEMSGFLNFALVGLSRLLEAKQFSFDKSSSEIKLEMMSSGSSIASFAYDVLEEKIDYKITKEDMYNKYCQYCHERGIAIESIEMLGRKMVSSAPYIRQGRTENNKTCWINVKFKGDSDLPPEPLPIDDIDFKKAEPLSQEEINLFMRQ